MLLHKLLLFPLEVLFVVLLYLSERFDFSLEVLDALLFGNQLSLQGGRRRLAALHLRVFIRLGSDGVVLEEADSCLGIHHIGLALPIHLRHLCWSYVRIQELYIVIHLPDLPYLLV